MFLNKTQKRNEKLIDESVRLHQNGIILPDTYVVDVDTFCDNAKKILNLANQKKIQLYFMLKQLGRNPYLAKKLVEIGYHGAVVVDFKEAKLMMDNQIPIANVGHLVQTPKAMIKKLVEYNCEYFTVYSLDKIKEINQAAQKLNRVQKIMLRVVENNDLIYSGQYAGFSLSEIKELEGNIKKLENVEIAGVTSFPCFIYNSDRKTIEETNNLNTILTAKKILETLGYKNLNINAPSTTSIETIELMSKYPITSGEPGHGLTGSVPMAATRDIEELPCVVYLSEVSHNFKNKGYFYGGGYYRRGHARKALVVDRNNNKKTLEVIPPEMDSIDYYFGLNEEAIVSSTVVMAFRFQIFVTRSTVCLIENIKNNPVIVGLYSSLGEKINE